MSTSRQEGKDTITFLDEETYGTLQELHPPESLAEVNSAIDPNTGEINWDCPCLGGMAQPPCGSFFKEAFTCFYSSTAEPKGIDCVDKFKEMQDCFRQFPEIYADQLDDSKDGSDEPMPEEESNFEEEEQQVPTDSEFTQSHSESAPLDGASMKQNSES